MAKVQVITEAFVCDFSGVELEPDEVEERKLKWEGKTYILELATEHAENLDEHLADFEAAKKSILTYVDAAKKKEKTKGKSNKSGGKTTSKSSTPRAPRAQSLTGEIREWARSNGWPELGKRGRIPEDVTKEYNQAHGL